MAAAGRYCRCGALLAAAQLGKLVAGFAVVDFEPCLDADASRWRSCEAAVAALDAAFSFSGLAVVLGLHALAHGGHENARGVEERLRSATSDFSELSARDAGNSVGMMQLQDSPSWSIEQQRQLGCLALWASGPAAEGSACHMNDTAYVLEVEGLAEAAAVTETEALSFPEAIGERCLRASSVSLGGGGWVMALARLRLALLEDFMVHLPVREAVVALVERALRLEPGALRSKAQVREVAGYRMHYYPAHAGRDGLGGEARFYHNHVDAGTVRLIRLDPLSPGGLEVELPGGDFIPVPYVRDSAVLLVGDTMERITNGRWRGARHRVNTGGGSTSRTTLRSSVFHFHPDEVLGCLPGCCTDGRGFKFPVLTAEQLMRHFRDNGAMVEPRGILF